jgi:seryl-tRNA synthetase
MSTKNADNQTKNMDATDQLSDNNVEKIRDILFGGNMRDYDKRFARLEDRLISDIERLSQDVFKRFENLDNYIRTEFENMSDKIHAEKTERKKEREDGINDIQNLQKQTDNRIADVEQQTSAEARTLRTSIHEQGNELLEMVRATRDELANSISAEARELQDVKVARSDLAELFSEVALRLNREFDLPE